MTKKKKLKIVKRYKFPFYFVMLAPWIDPSGSGSVAVADLRSVRIF